MYAAFFAFHAWSLVHFPYDWDQGEGYDAWSAWLLDRGQLPYTSNNSFPYYSSNYPPVWSYLASVPMAWIGPGLGAARAVSSIAAIGCAGLIGWAAYRRADRSLLAGMLAGGFFLASPFVFHSTPLARVNGLTLFFSLLAVTCFERPTNLRIAAGTVALLAALFTKQTSADAAVACLSFLLLTRPREGVAASIFLGGLGAIGLFVLDRATGGAFWLNVVAGNANPFDVRQLLDYLARFGLLHGVLLLAAAYEAWDSLKRRALSPWVFFWLASLVAGLAVAKVGAGESYFLGAVATTCVLGSARAALALRQASQSSSAQRLVAAALLLQAAILWHGPFGTLVPSPQENLLGRTPSAEDRAAGDELVTAIRRLPGPALSEDPSFAVAAGRPLVGNATHLRNLYDARLWDPTGLVADLASRRYDTVILNAQLYPQPVLDAIGRYYYVAQAVRMNGFTYLIFYPGSD